MTTPMISTTTESANVASPTGSAVRRLRRTLTVNATTSALGGLVAVVAPGFTADLLGTDREGWVRLVGAALVVFAADVALAARAKPSHLLRITPLIVAADVAWVAATIATIAAGWYSAGGSVVMATVGLAVAIFAFLQRRNARGVGRTLSRR